MTAEINARLATAAGFDWDDGNAPKVKARHDIDPGECEQAFFVEPFVLSYDDRHAADEPRWRALGQTLAGRMLFLVFAMRGSLIRVIAARDMNRKERRLYASIEEEVDHGSKLQD